MSEQRPTDRRAAKRRHERQNVLAACAILVVGGGGLIGMIYGPGAVLTALPFLLLGAFGIVVLYGILVAMENWAND